MSVIDDEQKTIILSGASLSSEVQLEVPESNMMDMPELTDGRHSVLKFHKPSRDAKRQRGRLIGNTAYEKIRQAAL